MNAGTFSDDFPDDPRYFTYEIESGVITDWWHENEKVKCNALAKLTMSNTEYNLLLQDYVCSVCIRIARDMFALLPIRNTIVHTVLEGKMILSVDFDRQNLSKVKFGYIDPSDALEKFKHNMEFDEANGFTPVSSLE